MENYQTKITGLNTEEIQALFFSRPDQLLSDLGMHQASEAAFIKLFAALPAASRRNAEYARQRIYVDTAGWRHSPDDISCLPAVQEAVWQERKLRLSYARDDACPTDRVLDPLGLIAKGSVWYLAASDGQKIRTYRVSRIRNPVMLEERAARPADFDLAAYWHHSSAEFKANLPRYYASVRVSPEVLHWLGYGIRFGRIESTEPSGESGWILLRIRFDAESAACQFALSFGDQVEVLDPPALREHVSAAAKGIVALYAGRNPL